MAYTHTTRNTSIYVGTSDDTMEAKINNLVAKVASWLSGKDDCSPLTRAFTVDGESKTLKAVKFADANDNFRLTFFPSGASTTPSTGCNLEMSMSYRKTDGSFGGATSLNNAEYLTFSKTFSILNNNPNTGLYIREDTFTNKTSSKVLKRIEFRPVAGSDISTTTSMYIMYAPLSNVCGNDVSEGFCFGSSQYGLPQWKRYKADAFVSYTYGTWSPFLFNGSSPNGNYAICSGLSAVITANSYGVTTVSEAWNVIDDSTLYAIRINGSEHKPELGATITISGSKFMSLGDGIFIRLT